MATRESARQLQAAAGGHHHSLDAVAHGDLELSLGVLHFREVDDSLTLAADIDKCDVVAETDNRPFDGLPTRILLGLLRRFEQCCKIVFWGGHGVLLGKRAWLGGVRRDARRQDNT